MLNSLEDSPLNRIANPESLAFFGASNNIASMGTNLLLSVQSIGYKGPIYPVHPKETEVQKLKAYSSVFDLPRVPDLAVIVLPTRIVNQTLEACGQKGIKHAIVVSGGFREVGGNGVALERELIEIAERYGMRILGPNCLGVANLHNNLNTTFIPNEGTAGYIGLASQSGSLVTQMFGYLSMFGLGFSTAFSVGNEANVDLVDCMAYLGACPATKVIALYIEGIKRGKAFVETARAIAPHKPIVAFYIGGSETGRRAGFSHTGSMAGPDRLYDGIFRQSGVIRAQSIVELFDFCWVLGSLGRSSGPRVVVQTHSGGPGAAAADACGRSGLEMPPISPGTVEKLAPFMPHTGSVTNPVDITFSKNPMDYLSNIPKVLLEEPNADMLMVYFLMPSKTVRRALRHMGITEEQIAEQSKKVVRGQCKAVARLLETQQRPLVGYTFHSLTNPFIHGLIERGVPVFPSPERAARALRALVDYTRLRKHIMESDQHG